MLWLKIAALIYIFLLITFTFFFSSFGSLPGRIALNCRYFKFSGVEHSDANLLLFNAV